MGQQMIQLEEFPLQQHTYYQKRPRGFKGPLRVIRLCIFGIVLPAIFISLPLYLKYHVYATQLYPFAVSDMRLLDRRISTVWCQRQAVKLNTTFNAFVLPHHPHLASERKPLSMERSLLLEDDMKEYWGFYLLKGSTVTISTCVRWPGASLIVIRGHKHLHDCVYIGDDSSEELEELLEIAREGVYVNTNGSNFEDAFPNAPDLMKRHRVDIHFHHPSHRDILKNQSISIDDEHDDISDISDPKLVKSLLDLLSKKSKKKASAKLKDPKHINGKSTLINDNEEKENRTTSEEIFQEISNKLDALGDKQHSVLQKLNARSKSKPGTEDDSNIRQKNMTKSVERSLNVDDEKGNVAIEEGFQQDGIADHRGVINETTLNDRSNSEFWSSFSSSEEALLNCEGLILNLPLTPHKKCSANSIKQDLDEASLENTVTYLVPKNGYYFFVFNSENEVQTNYVRVHFSLNKTVYDVSHPTASCSNQANSCTLDLSFFSEDRIVMELPANVNESRWNDDFIVVSECEPRTLLYLICVLAVPILIVLFAFQ